MWMSILLALNFVKVKGILLFKKLIPLIFLELMEYEDRVVAQWQGRCGTPWVLVSIDLIVFGIDEIFSLAGGQRDDGLCLFGGPFKV
jgi:hypothetical protein